LKSYLKKLKQKIDSHKNIIHNLGYLSTLQFVTIIVPLLTIPYLLKILGKETYGLLIFSNTIVSYFLVLINFGFNLSATKDISIHRFDKKKLSEIVSSVLIIKGVFFILSWFLLLFVLNVFPNLMEFKILFYLMMYLCLYEWLFPIWYFQGIEKMKYITFINVFSRLFFVGLVFILVKERNDFLKVPIINGLGFLISSIIGLFVVFYVDKIKFRWQSFKILRYYLVESLPLFLGNIAGKIKLLSNKAILGAFVGLESVATYDIIDKIKDVFLMFLQLISQVLYPSLSSTKNGNIIRITVKYLFSVGVIIYLVVGIIISLIIPVYFSNFSEGIYLFWILGILIIIQPISYLIGTGVLVVNDFKKEYSRNLYLSAGIYLLLIGLVYLFDYINVISVALSLVISAFSGIISNIIVCKRKKILKWII